MGQEWSDTIAAIATARGRAALAIVRLTGPEAVRVASRVFSGIDLETVASHTAHVGYVRTTDGNDIDQVVATVFRAPRTVTGEDVVEISCHGGDFGAQMILGALLGSGARAARPGEFTQRSFLNGKIDLAQAEAIGDLIHASSTAAHRASLSHLKGRYSELLAGLRSELLELAAFIELELDFSDEDVEFADRDRLETLLARVDDTLSRLLASYPLGERLREGVRVVIGGRPNAGKSTLLNALVGHERAIVSAQPGTTRDEIEVDAEIGGLRFRFVDTAGIRLTDDAVEAEGVRRARRAIDLADILIYVYDAARGLEPDEESLIAEIQVARSDLPFIVVANKLDLAPGAPADHLGLSATAARQDERLLVPLIDRMSQAATDGITDVDASAVVMNQRHVQHLKTALAAVERARRAMRHGESGDLLALDLRTALDELGAITGEITNEDVLDQIFSRFCIGK